MMVMMPEDWQNKRLRALQDQKVGVTCLSKSSGYQCIQNIHCTENGN